VFLLLSQLMLLMPPLMLQLLPAQEEAFGSSLDALSPDQARRGRLWPAVLLPQPVLYCCRANAVSEALL
jgi:hypothetical protein